MGYAPALYGIRAEQGGKQQSLWAFCTDACAPAYTLASTTEAEGFVVRMG